MAPYGIFNLHFQFSNIILLNFQKTFYKDRLDTLFKLKCQSDPSNFLKHFSFSIFQFHILTFQLLFTLSEIRLQFAALPNFFNQKKSKKHHKFYDFDEGHNKTIVLFLNTLEMKLKSKCPLSEKIIRTCLK